MSYISNFTDDSYPVLVAAYCVAIMSDIAAPEDFYEFQEVVLESLRSTSYNRLDEFRIACISVLNGWGVDRLDGAIYLLLDDYDLELELSEEFWEGYKIAKDQQQAVYLDKNKFISLLDNLSKDCGVELSKADTSKIIKRSEFIGKIYFPFAIRAIFENATLLGDSFKDIFNGVLDLFEQVVGDCVDNVSNNCYTIFNKYRNNPPNKKVAKGIVSCLFTLNAHGGDITSILNIYGAKEFLGHHSLILRD